MVYKIGMLVALGCQFDEPVHFFVNGLKYFVVRLLQRNNTMQESIPTEFDTSNVFMCIERSVFLKPSLIICHVLLYIMIARDARMYGCVFVNVVIQ